MIVLLYPVVEEIGGEPFNNEKIKSMIVGIGEKSMQATESLSGSIDLTVLLGTAGALDDKLRVGDIVVVDNYISHDGLHIPADPEPCSLICSILKREGLEFQVGSSLTVPVFMQGLRSNVARILDMEDFYVAKVLREKKVPTVVIRIVSDLTKEALSGEELRERIIASGIILREKFVVPFLKAMTQQR